MTTIFSLTAKGGSFVLTQTNDRERVLTFTKVTDLNDWLDKNNFAWWQGSAGLYVDKEKAIVDSALERPAQTDRLIAALRNIAALAEFGTTGPGKCTSPPLSAAKATSLRLSISSMAREALLAAKVQP